MSRNESFLSLARLMYSGMRSTVPISCSIMQRRLVGAAMRRSPQTGDAG